jgi:hypothetical protein
MHVEEPFQELLEPIILMLVRKILWKVLCHMIKQSVG